MTSRIQKMNIKMNKIVVVLMFSVILVFANFGIQAQEKGDTSNGTDTENRVADSTVRPFAIPKLIFAVLPNYPDRARFLRKGGTVIVEFTITVTGSVVDARVVHAEPEGMFEEEAIKAIQRFRFKPVEIEGKIVPYKHTMKLKFDNNDFFGPHGLK